MAGMLCERCGAPLPEGARFCPQCGTPVTVVTTEERKVVTILFADLAASTELAARVDPERFREVMAAFYGAAAEELESLRGRAEKFVGDAVMAVWGLPHAHDDDALRAVRAGMAIRDRVGRLGASLALPLPLVDRRHELALLVDTFDRVRQTGRAHLITVLGEPGIGKTRLVDEFVAGLPEDVKVLSGGASRFEEDVTFAPLSEMILRELGVDHESASEVVRGRLHELVEGCCEPSEVEQVAARLGVALGLGTEDGGPDTPGSDAAGRPEDFAKAEGQERHRFRVAEVRTAFQIFLEGLARLGPVVMVLEDFQLVLPDFFDLVEAVLR